eukprot:1182621-Prorocentrum_minimum.AAC.3
MPVETLSSCHLMIHHARVCIVGGVAFVSFGSVAFGRCTLFWRRAAVRFEKIQCRQQTVDSRRYTVDSTR